MEMANKMIKNENVKYSYDGVAQMLWGIKFGRVDFLQNIGNVYDLANKTPDDIYRIAKEQNVKGVGIKTSKMFVERAKKCVKELLESEKLHQAKRKKLVKVFEYLGNNCSDCEATQYEHLRLLEETYPDYHICENIDGKVTKIQFLGMYEIEDMLSEIDGKDTFLLCNSCFKKHINPDGSATIKGYIN